MNISSEKPILTPLKKYYKYRESEKKIEIDTMTGKRDNK